MQRNDAANQPLTPFVRRLACGAAAVVGLAVAVGLYFAWQAALLALSAENTLQAHFYVCKAAAKYVEQHPGQWPRDWDELMSAADSPEEGHPWMPVEEIKQRIHVDFTMAAEEVAASDPAHFTAIVQAEPNFGPREAEVEFLQRTIRDSLRR